MSFLFILKIGDFMDILTVLPRGLLSLFTLFLVTKMIGKKQVSELSLFDYVIGLSIGNFVAEITINNQLPLINGLLAIVVFGMVSYLVTYITMKSMKLRRILIGVPTVIVDNGKLIEKNMSKTKYDVNDFLQECRNNGYFDVSQIEYAIVEVNGKISILPKSEYNYLTPKDMKLKTKKAGLCANVIIDSQLIENNLKNIHKTKKWLDQELKVMGYQNYQNILLATIDNEEKINVYEKNTNKVLNILE